MNTKTVTEKLNRSRTHARDINELLGICKGIAFDNQVNESEAVSLSLWLRSHPEIQNVWPASALNIEVNKALAQEKYEGTDLIEAVKKIAGENEISETVDLDTGEATYRETSTALPVEVVDSIEHDGKLFVLTGKFGIGTREECESMVALLGGRCQKSPTKKTSYLVIGEQRSADWAMSSSGRKIQKAMLLKEDGSSIKIISEEHWRYHCDLINQKI